MGFLSQLFGALRENSTSTPAADTPAIDDEQQAIQLLETEVSRLKANLVQAKSGLAELMSKQSLLEKQQIIPRQRKITALEMDVLHALLEKNEAKAHHLAESIADLENEIEAHNSIHQGYDASIKQLRTTIHNIERQIATIEREFMVIKATEHINKAQEINHELSSDSPNSVTEALSQLRARQQKRSDQLQAAISINQSTDEEEQLQDRLKEAGIIKADSTKHHVLARMKSDEPQATKKSSSKKEEPVTKTWVKENHY